MPRKARKMTGSRGALDELRAHMRKHEQIAGHNSEGTKRVRADQPGPTCRGQRGVSTCAPPPTQSEELKGTASTDLGDVVVLREVLELFVELCDTLLVRLDGRLCRLFEELRAVRGCPWGQSWAGWRAAAREGRTRLRWTSSKRRWASVLPDAATLVLLLRWRPRPRPQSRRDSRCAPARSHSPTRPSRGPPRRAPSCSSSTSSSSSSCVGVNRDRGQPGAVAARRGAMGRGGGGGAS